MAAAAGEPSGALSPSRIGGMTYRMVNEQARRQERHVPAPHLTGAGGDMGA